METHHKGVVGGFLSQMKVGLRIISHETVTIAHHLELYNLQNIFLGKLNISSLSLTTVQQSTLSAKKKRKSECDRER